MSDTIFQPTIDAIKAEIEQRRAGAKDPTKYTAVLCRLLELEDAVRQALRKEA